MLRHRLLLVVLAFLAAGCGEERHPAPERVPGRPDDGLLTDTALQAVVDLQVAREGKALAERLSHPDARVRARAAFALGSVLDTVAVPALLEALDDASPRVRADAAFALGQVGAETGSDAVATALVEALAREPAREARRTIVEAIGKVGGPEAIDALARYDDPRLAGDIALALSRAAVRDVWTEASVERASAGLTHPDPEVRMSSAYLLGRAPNTAMWYGERRRARLALGTYSMDDPAAMWVLQGLGRAGDVFSRETISRWGRESPDWRIRVNAVRALAGRIPDAATVETALAALDDRSPHVRIVAAEVLAGFPFGPTVTERIEAWIGRNRDDWRTVGRLLVALGQSGSGEFVLGWLEDVPLSDLERWRLGVEALSYVGGEGAFRMLNRLLDSPHHQIAGAAMESLANRWKQDRSMDETHDAYWRTFSEALREGDPRVVHHAAEALADPVLASRGSIELLLQFYDRIGDEAGAAPRVSVLEALGRAEDPAGVPLLRRELRHPLPAVREAAGTALVGIVGGSVELPSQVTVDEERRAAGDTLSGRRPDPDLPDFLGRSVDWDRLRALGPHPLLHLETEKGEIVVRLDAVEAPATVQTIAELAAAGKYDGVPFHRVVPNFVVQTGDFERGDGTGGPGFRIGSELTRIPYRRGVIGMANAGRDTEGSQFFVTHSPQPHLDGGYTSFGYVVEGMDVVDRILRGDTVTRARVEPGR